LNGGDAAPAAILERHFERPGDERLGKWRHRFYDLIAEARLCQRDPRIAAGSDGFPYYNLDIPRAGGPGGTIRIPALIELATSSGFGITVNCGGRDPWVFTCGDLVTRRAFGTYEFPRIGIPGAGGAVLREVRTPAGGVSIGAPPATLLPRFVQPLLRRYFTERLGITQPGALAMLSSEQDPPEQLVFRLSRADFSDEVAFEAALAGVTWFLPRHIVVSVLPPDAVVGLERAFVPLLG
jgi:hypothetical protein